MRRRRFLGLLASAFVAPLAAKLAPAAVDVVEFAPLPVEPLWRSGNMAAGFDVSYEMLTRDYANVEYSSLRELWGRVDA